MSDKFITKHCGLLGKLLPGDFVLADRGFDIADSCGLYGARLKIPAFTKGRPQLSLLDIESTRKIAEFTLKELLVVSDKSIPFLATVFSQLTIYRQTMKIHAC